MHKNKTNRNLQIPPEKMAILAEKGLKEAKLTKEEKQYLLNGGLEELYDIWQIKKRTITLLSAEAVDTIMNKFHNKTILRFMEIHMGFIKKDTLHVHINIHIGIPNELIKKPSSLKVEICIR